MMRLTIDLSEHDLVRMDPGIMEALIAAGGALCVMEGGERPRARQGDLRSCSRLRCGRLTT